MRVNHNLKVAQVPKKLGGPKLPAAQTMSENPYGRANRPQTPVNGVIHGQFHEESEMEL